jgi:hypothetical protein
MQKSSLGDPAPMFGDIAQSKCIQFGTVNGSDQRFLEMSRITYDEALASLASMFPGAERGIIEAVLESNGMQPADAFAVKFIC